MGNKIIVEFDRIMLKSNCVVLGGRYCKECKKTDYDLIFCNTKTTDYKIKEQNDGNKGTED